MIYEQVFVLAALVILSGLSLIVAVDLIIVLIVDIRKIME